MSGNIGRHTLFDIIGNRLTAAATGAVTTTDKIMAYIKQLVTNGRVSVAAGTTDVDISESDYTGFIDILTILAPADGLPACRIDIDVNKATTGLDTVATAADTFDCCVVGSPDGTNYRLIQNGTQITANGDGSLEMSENGFSFDIGPVGPSMTIKVKLKLSAERDDAELPYRVTYLGAAPTITAVAAG